jgi:hypothetical protein
METNILHFDSVDSQYQTISNSTSSSKTNAYNTLFTLRTPIKDVRQIRLKSIELPITFSNIRTGSTDNLILRINGNSYNITIEEQIITSISSLLTLINDAILEAIPEYSIVFSLPTNTYKVSLLSDVDIIIRETTLSKYIIGFDIDTEVSENEALVASSNYNLNVDNYLNFTISNIPSSTTNANGFPCTFKIPINAVSNSIYYWSENMSFTQWIDTTKFDITTMSVVIRDRFNNDINPNGGDYSFTLQIASGF